jgi:hypothetical protein
MKLDPDPSISKRWNAVQVDGTARLTLASRGTRRKRWAARSKIHVNEHDSNS